MKHTPIPAISLCPSATRAVGSESFPCLLEMTANARVPCLQGDIGLNHPHRRASDPVKRRLLECLTSFRLLTDTLAVRLIQDFWLKPAKDPFNNLIVSVNPRPYTLSIVLRWFVECATVISPRWTLIIHRPGRIDGRLRS